MGMTTISSRDFNQGASRAKKAARNGPVYITERGKPTHVLMTIEDFHRRKGTKPRSLLASLAQTGEAGNFDFEPPKLNRITRSEERRVGKYCDNTSRSLLSPYK